MNPGYRRIFTPAVALAVVTAPALAQARPEPPELIAARAAYQRTPTNLDSIIWYGRRVGYTGAFTDAVAIYTEGLRIHPNEPHLLRHRGHRYISLRDFPRAIADLTLARQQVAGKPDEVEPDGQPNARGIPTSTLHSNIRYHLALAHFVTGAFLRALPVWEEDAQVAKTLDQRVAATYWLVLTLAHLGRTQDVVRALEPVRADWDIIENGSYHQLLLWMKGDISEAELFKRAGTTVVAVQTAGNGVGQWHLAHQRSAEARAAFDRVLATGPAASFGFIAAEQAVRRLRP